MAEAKLGDRSKFSSNSGGFGGTLDFPVIGQNGRLGFEAGIIILSNWTDTLDLWQSPTLDDTLMYDLWIKNGTDLDFFIGPSARYKLDLTENTALSAIVGSGILINISAYDETKKALDPPPLYSKSEAPANIEFYIKPKLVFHLKRIYIGYEFFGITEELEHVVCLGITF